MKNIHPVYHIKHFLIKRELMKDENLKNVTVMILIQENWDRFLPKFRKKNMKRKKVIIKKKSENIFPPPQLPRKEDIEMEAGIFHNKKKSNKNKQK